MRRAGQGNCQALLVKWHLLQGWSPRGGTGTRFGVEALAKAPQAAGAASPGRQEGAKWAAAEAVLPGDLRQGQLAAHLPELKLLALGTALVAGWVFLTA